MLAQQKPKQAFFFLIRKIELGVSFCKWKCHDGIYSVLQFASKNIPLKLVPSLSTISFLINVSFLC